MKTLEEQIEAFKEQLEKEKSYQISVAERNFQTKVRNATLREHQRSIIKNMSVEELEFGNFFVEVKYQGEVEEGNFKPLRCGRVIRDEKFKLSKVSEKMEKFLLEMSKVQLQSNISEILFAKEDRRFRITIGTRIDDIDKRQIFVSIEETNDIEFIKWKQKQKTKEAKFTTNLVIS